MITLKRFKIQLAASLLLMFLGPIATLMPPTMVGEDTTALVMLVGLILSLLFALFSWRSLNAEPEQELKARSDADRLKNNIRPIKLNESFGSFLASIIETLLLNAVDIRPSTPSIGQEQETVTEDSEDDIPDDASSTILILTPPESEVEPDASIKSIEAELEHFREKKKILNAAEADQKYDRQVARLNVEEAMLYYEWTPKSDAAHEDRLMALKKFRIDCEVLERKKKRKALQLKRIDLEIENLERKKREKTE